MNIAHIKAKKPRGLTITLIVLLALAALPAALRSGANDRQRRERAAFHILRTLEDTLELTYQNPNGPIETVVVRRPEQVPPPVDRQHTPAGPLITLPDGWCLIRIPTFSARNSHDLFC